MALSIYLHLFKTYNHLYPRLYTLPASIIPATPSPSRVLGRNLDLYRSDWG